jgi:hypothetical protein
MSVPAHGRRPATYEDLLAVPDHLLTTASGGEVLRVEPFDASDIDLNLLWAD